MVANVLVCILHVRIIHFRLPYCAFLLLAPADPGFVIRIVYFLLLCSEN